MFKIIMILNLIVTISEPVHNKLTYFKELSITYKKQPIQNFITDGNTIMVEIHDIILVN